MMPCHMNGSSGTTQGHDENIQPTRHHLKWVPVTTKCQGKKRNSTIDQLNSNVLTKNRCEVLTNLNGPVDSNGVDISPKLNSANINLLRCNNQHSKARKPENDNEVLNKRGCNSCNLPYQLPKLQPATRPKTLHTHMSLNYTIPNIVNGQVFPSESDKMGAVSDRIR